jgi:hypothetical protein
VVTGQITVHFFFESFYSEVYSSTTGTQSFYEDLRIDVPQCGGGGNLILAGSEVSSHIQPASKKQGDS